MRNAKKRCAERWTEERERLDDLDLAIERTRIYCGDGLENIGHHLERDYLLTDSC
jgi:hypothetical protein